MKLAFRNRSAETVPPYGVVETQAAHRRSNSQMYLDGYKPGTLSGNKTYLVNGPIAVPPDGCGTCTSDEIVWVASHGLPEEGEEIGPVDDSWTAGPGGRGFLALHTDVYENKTLSRVLTAPGECFQIIQFEVKAVGDEDHPLGVEAWFRAVTCGCPLRPDQYFDFYQKTVWVIDPLGCFFNQPEDAIIGLNGYAARFPQIEKADEQGCGWWVISLCCPGCID